MNALATVIACYGLFANSTAAVIGAMVVAMLLGPISGVAFGLNEGNAHLFRVALLSLSAGIVWILAIAVAVGFIHRDVPLTDQILSRTDPKAVRSGDRPGRRCRGRCCGALSRASAWPFGP